MRTTVDLPDETFRRAKVAAVERGTTLRQLVREALEKELGMNPSGRAKRTVFPVFGSRRPGTLDVDIVKQVELADDQLQDGLAR